jgi:hypothetical protein
MALPLVGLAQEGADFGKYEYYTNYAKCAWCHGISGRGDGVVAKYLTKEGSDRSRDLCQTQRRDCMAGIQTK